MSTNAFLEQTLASRLGRGRPDETWNQSYQVTFRDLRPLKLNLGAYVAFLTQAGFSPGGISDWHRLVDDLVLYSREKTNGSATIFVTDQTCPGPIFDHPLLAQHSVAILDKETTGGFLAQRELLPRYLVLGRAVARGVGFSALSPYIPGKPASGGRFFGRSRLLDQIVSGKMIHNCTIVGNRRIGKTSLMHEARERLNEVYISGKNIFFADLYGAKLKSTWDAVYLVCSQISLNVPKNYTKLGAISERYILRFPKLLHKFAKERDAAVVLFIDEFDSFLEIDSHQNYEFLHLLREAAMADANCYVIIAGFRRLMETRVRQESPYFNFTNEIPIGRLTKDEVLEMVTTPLARMGIEVDPELPALIYKETRGQPELIQMYCGSIVELYKKTGATPTPNELLSHVHRNPAFNRTLLHTFLKNTNPFEQLICLHLIRRALKEDAIRHFEFSVRDVDELRIAMQFPLSNADTSTLLNNLCVGSIIDRVTGAPGRYQFAVPQLIRFFKKDLDISSLLPVAEAEAKRLPPTIQALNMDTPEESEIPSGWTA